VRIFLFATVSRPAVGSTQPRSQWLAVFFLWGKRPGREADHSPPSSAEIKMRGVTPPLPHTFSWREA